MPALDGMRILDMTQYEAGTSCTQALAWFGADVVKLERPGVGDPGRGVASGAADSAYFINWNSNKRSVTIDLQRPEGREVLLKMLPRLRLLHRQPSSFELPSAPSPLHRNLSRPFSIH